MNCIKIEFCAEDRARMDRLAAAVEALTMMCEAMIDRPMNAAAASEPVKAVPASDPLPAPQPEAEPVPAAEPEKPSVTLAQIQHKAAHIAASSDLKKGKLRAIISAYADRVSAIPESAFDEVWSKLEALESEA